MVLRFGLILDECEYKKGQVRFIFLIRGHTKNNCDRAFNKMKKFFRKHNILRTNNPEVLPCS